MPYISHHGKDELKPILKTLLKWVKDYTLEDTWKNTGNLNYIITQILLEMRPRKYSDYNALVGVLECCKLEFYRRAVAAYEDEKIQENGDVY